MFFFSKPAEKCFLMKLLQFDYIVKIYIEFFLK